MCVCGVMSLIHNRNNRSSLPCSEIDCWCKHKHHLGSTVPKCGTGEEGRGEREERGERGEGRGERRTLPACPAPTDGALHHKLLEPFASPPPGVYYGQMPLDPSMQREPPASPAGAVPPSPVPRPPPTPVAAGAAGQLPGQMLLWAPSGCSPAPKPAQPSPPNPRQCPSHTSHCSALAGTELSPPKAWMGSSKAGEDHPKAPSQLLCN